ncbi:phosphatase PAP2 family protein [Rhodobium gokarnense]|uniref:Membrane-associated PAP2 superfamily phosphatase n=1 Tax=Rhodobium gokarnense TaxID=364296 RepID=A0ABT3HA27_9HYPH|nr:phosphatase PAP2 family protein [Rhodobium gokarnense]MCW2307204.1 membrane-associated PAP2 superfamily phosphatase [Rhodobium gokarnense]
MHSIDFQNASRRGIVATATTTARYRPIAAILIVTAALSLFFNVFPDVDIAVSGVFYEPGVGFPLHHDPFLRRLRDLNPFLSWLLGLSAAAALLAWMLVERLRRHIDIRAPVFVLTSMALAPGLLVNVMLKGNWGRARPKNVDVFGGDHPFSPVWEIVDYCHTNCSFTSGEASTAAFLLVVVFLAPACWRLPATATVGALAAALSINRVAFGAHFLSDVLLSWTLTLAVTLTAYKLLYKKPPQWLQKPRLEAAFARLAAATAALARRIARGAGRLRAHSRDLLR